MYDSSSVDSGLIVMIVLVVVVVVVVVTVHTYYVISVIYVNVCTTKVIGKMLYML